MIFGIENDIVVVKNVFNRNVAAGKMLERETDFFVISDGKGTKIL